MMNRQALRQKIEKQHHARERREQDLRQRMRMRGGANTSASKNQKERVASLESSQKEDKVIKWPQIFKGWWDLMFRIKFLTKHLRKTTRKTMPNKHIFSEIKWAITRPFKRKNLPLKRPQIKGLEISRTLLKIRMRMNSKSIMHF